MVVGVGGKGKNYSTEKSRTYVPSRVVGRRKNYDPWPPDFADVVKINLTFSVYQRLHVCTQKSIFLIFVQPYVYMMYQRRRRYIRYRKRTHDAHVFSFFATVHILHSAYTKIKFCEIQSLLPHGT